MKSALAFIGLAIFAVVAFDFIRSYRQSTRTGWQKVWDGGRGSATIVWQQFGLALAGVVAAIDKIVDLSCQMFSDQATADSITAAINRYSKPEYVALAVAAFMAVTVLARRRSLKSGG